MHAARVRFASHGGVLLVAAVVGILLPAVGLAVPQGRPPIDVKELVIVDSVGQAHLVALFGGPAQVFPLKLPIWLQDVVARILNNSEPIIGVLDTSRRIRVLGTTAEYLAIVDTSDRVYFVLDFNRSTVELPEWIKAVVAAVNSSRSTDPLGTVLTIMSPTTPTAEAAAGQTN